jgi:hypothetical protein
MQRQMQGQMESDKRGEGEGQMERDTRVLGREGEGVRPSPSDAGRTRLEHGPRSATASRGPPALRRPHSMGISSAARTSSTSYTTPPVRPADD